MAIVSFTCIARSLLIRTRVDVDVAVTNARGGKHHTVRVKGRAGNGGRAGGGEERGPGLQSIEVCAIDVEEG